MDPTMAPLTLSVCARVPSDEHAELFLLSGSDRFPSSDQGEGYRYFSLSNQTIKYM